MPVHKRRFFLRKLTEAKQKEKQQIEQQSTKKSSPPPSPSRYKNIKPSSKTKK